MPLQTEQNKFCYPFHNMGRPNGMVLPLSQNIQVSIQWNWGNHCDNHWENHAPGENPLYVSNTVEIAFIENGDFVRPNDWCDDIKGHLTVEEMWKEIHKFQRERGLLHSYSVIPFLP